MDAPDPAPLATCDGTCAEPNCRNGIPLIDWDNPITQPETR